MHIPTVFTQTLRVFKNVAVALDILTKISAISGLLFR